MTNTANVIINYKFFLKHMRGAITKRQYFYRGVTTNHIPQKIFVQSPRGKLPVKSGVGLSDLRKGNNNPLMFVRAPKHFKSGKQHIFFFNSTFYRRHELLIKHPSAMFFLNSRSLFNKLSLLREFSHNSILISRITLINTLKIKLGV